MQQPRCISRSCTRTFRHHSQLGTRRHSTQQGTDPFIRCVDAARRVATFGWYTIIVRHAIQQCGRGRCHHCCRKRRSRSGRHGKGGVLEMHPLTITRSAVKRSRTTSKPEGFKIVLPCVVMEHDSFSGHEVQ